MKPCAFLPGERITCDWPWWGEWTCNVQGYDPTSRTVLLNDGWGSTELFPIGEVWLPREKAKPANRKLFVWKVLAIGAAMGAIVGAVVTAVALR
jgi:hypothetical protein